MRQIALLPPLIACGGLVCFLAAPAISGRAQTEARIERRSEQAALHERFTASQMAILEKLNRADVAHLEQLGEVVLPERWREDELSYSVLPARYAYGEHIAKLLVVHLPGQLFGAYEFGDQVRWGPISSGGRDNPTPTGLFALNWRSTERSSTINPDWFMRWYFNFGNRDGLAFHAYSLPGFPASHGCIRLLDRDARWLFDWGDEWALDESQTRVLKPGTRVFIVGAYDFDTAPPWRSLTWLAQTLALPSPRAVLTQASRARWATPASRGPSTSRERVESHVIGAGC